MAVNGRDFVGARFYRADLHVHTPASKDWRGGRTKDEMKRIFEKLKEKEIEVVAITDHNTTVNIEESKQLGRKYGIHVFPGVEVSTKEGHVLAIFDPAKKGREIGDWLAKMGFAGKKLGDLESMAEDQDGTALGIEKVFALIEKAEGIAIAPHPNSKGAGFLAVMRPKGLAKIAAYCSPYLRGLEVGDNKEKILHLASGKLKDYPKKYGCVATSDAHSIEDIGKSFTYIKLGDFSVSALKQVLYDPAMRIRFEDEWPLQRHPWIRRLEVSQGFFDGVIFDFHPDMNCLVGGKAVGKSLLIELMKFALGVDSPIKEINENSEGMMWAKTCLGNDGTVSVHVVSENGDCYRIQRTVSDLDSGPEVYYEEGQAKAASNVKDIFQCEIYSQNEVIELGKTLSALLEWLDGFIDLSEEQQQIDDVRKGIKSLLTKLDAFHNAAKKIRSLKTKNEDLETRRTYLERTIKKPILRTFPKWQSEERHLRKMQKGLRELKDQLVEPVKKVKVDDYIPSPQKGTPNYREIVAERQKVVGVADQFQKLGVKLEQAVTAREKALTAYMGEWRKKYEEARKQHERVIGTAGVRNAAALTSQLDKVNEAIETMDAELENAETAAKKKKSIEIELRSRLVPEYSRLFADIFKKRSAKATAITKSLNSIVRIHVFQMSDRSGFEKELERLGKGSGLRVPERGQIAAKATPIELAELILDRNAKGLSEKTGIRQEKIATFIECAWAKNTTDDGFETPSHLYRMMLTELKDTVNVELQVAGGAYKPMNELSGGSKCTAILSVALVEGGWPLMVDQPEDALDNPFVFEKIVKTVRRSKTGRQYIFATHNPNIAVSSDADLIYCLRATASEGDIEKQGSIDEVSTRDKVVANLEGGENAFRLRSQKYDIVVDDPTAVILESME